LGVKIILNKTDDLSISQWEAYELPGDIPREQALKAILNHMDDHKITELYSSTQIIIVPSYSFKMVDKLITNFHMPRSTLLLLIAAFIGDDWKKVYSYALENEFRFLSYGDSSLLIP
jgi:S-adenosylmethionine:tRNA ribosyltransferase-isomerase